MMHHRHHQIAIGLASILVFIVGMVLGGYLATHLGIIDLEGIEIALLLTMIILLLMIGSLVLEIKRLLSAKKR
jgi:hypothetical protein